MEKLIQILENVLGKGRETNKGNYAFHCPFCNSSKRKLEIQVVSQIPDENHFHCWTCNTSGKKLINLFKKLQQPREVIAELMSILNVSTYYTDTTQPKYNCIKLPDEYKPLWRNTSSIEQKNALKVFIFITFPIEGRFPKPFLQ